MTSDTFTDLLEEIRNARTSRMDWVLLARTVSKMLEMPEMRSRYASKEAFWEELVEATGYTRNALQRMSSTIRQMEAHEKAEKKFLQEELGLKKWQEGTVIGLLEHFAKMEVYLRLFKYDPATAIKLLKRMQNERVSVLEIKNTLSRVLDQNPSLRKQNLVLPSQKKAEEARRLAVLEQQKSLIYDETDVSIYFDHFKFQLVSVDAIGLTHGEEGRIYNLDGFMFLKGPAPKTSAAFRDLLSAIDYRASFFRHLWLYAPNIHRWPLDQILTSIDQLGINQVGILEFDPADGLKVIRQPEGTEKPMRYNTVMNEVVRQGIQDYGMA